MNSVGEHKGVDSPIVTDTIALARNRAISDAVLVSGDEGLRVGVQQAQEFGVQVHLIGIKPSRGSQSLFLLQEADTTHEWSTDEVSTFLKRQPNPALEAAAPIDPVGIVPAQAHDPLKTIASQVAARLEQTEIQALVDAVERAGHHPQRMGLDSRDTFRFRLSVSDYTRQLWNFGNPATVIPARFGLCS